MVTVAFKIERRYALWAYGAGAAPAPLGYVKTREQADLGMTWERLKQAQAQARARAQHA